MSLLEAVLSVIFIGLIAAGIYEMFTSWPKDDDDDDWPVGYA